MWANNALPTLPQPCRLCPDTDFVSHEDWVCHASEEHGGLQRYRNALFSLLVLKPYAVKGQEWRSIITNYSEFFSRSAMDWEHFTPRMKQLLGSEDGLSAHDRWAPRGRHTCVFCCRGLWREELTKEFLAGPNCFMKAHRLVADLLAW